MKTVFGGTIAVVLLGIYVHLLTVAYLIVDSVSRGATDRPPAGFNDLMAQTLTVIGGLVSALVIAELAVTNPGDPPMTRMLDAKTTPIMRSLLKWVSVVYVLVWLIAGLVAFMKTMYNPNVLPAFTSVGQAWLGLSVAAAYAYFGLKPAKP